MLEDEALLLLPAEQITEEPTEDTLPDSDGKPVDNELQVLAPVLLRAILTYIWGDRTDWFFAINLGLYYDTKKPAIGPDAFLSLGVPRVRPSNKLRLSYLVREEKVMPQWVLEVVSREPGGEYDEKFKCYAEIGVLYYTIYNPSHYRRDRHEPFEVYRLEDGQYVQQFGNPVWMPELGLGIGHEVVAREGCNRDWLYWYDESGVRHLAPEDALAQEQILRGQEQLIRRELEEALEAEQLQRLAQEQAWIQAQQELEREEQARIQAQQELEREEQARIQAQQELGQAKQARRSFVLRLLARKMGAIDDSKLELIQALSIEQLESLGEALLEFESMDDLTVWLTHQV